MTKLASKQVLLPFAPYPHQKAAHKNRLRVRFNVLVWHRRAGKTVFSVLELLLAALECVKQRGRFAYVAPQLKQAKAVAWDYLKHYARSVPGVEVNESELRIDLPNGAQIRVYGADNPDSLRGLYFDGIVLDEVADMDPKVWGEIIRPALADRLGWAIFIGTPKGVNLFSELYYKAAKGYDDEGKPTPDWCADLKRYNDTDILAPGEVEAARAEMSEAQFAQEFGCDFNAAVEDVLLKLSDVMSAQDRDVGRDAYINAAKVFGVDVARYGGDRIVLQVRQGVVAFTPKVWRNGMSVMQLAGQVAFNIDEEKKSFGREPDAVFIDNGAMGAGVVDRLRELGYKSIIGIDFGSQANDASRFENKRSEMWWDLANWVKEVGCLPAGQEIQTDLISPRYTVKNKRGRIQLESKDDMRKRGLKSPDVGDALALTFSMPVVPKDIRTQIVQGLHTPAHLTQGAVQHEYNPYDRED